ncbi:LOW QUALITY PROTEIN: uncharacterized protein LOC126794198 [Argentina anserina]|uniref:LOW QUALITY PROTEIN: uncharacterized protein LOC126794198 n=1 Tax=Argentina anserina TaxID=57926 RepID=UPI00217662E7|nr:LOW QUALITY PROTEIN: uncharacterized protein LOC126794198 [Potentilla anserina]
MVRHRRSSETSPAAELRSKLRRVVRGQEQMKTAFHQLKSQIQIGLLQAEDVFASLSIPLMKLVGLKTVEMATEGRFTSFIIQTDSDLTSQYQNFGAGSGPSGRSDQSRQCANIEIYAAKAAAAGDSVIEKQKDQLIQLVRILKQVESQVNNGQSRMVQTLANRRHSLRRNFQRAIAYLSTVDHQGFRVAVLNLLREIFNEVSAVLASVEADVEGLVEILAEKMCEPMVEYVEGVKADLRNGTCLGLVGLVKEMARAELEAARNKANVAEESRAEAMRRLRESEEYVRRLKECFKLLPEPSKASTKVNKAFASHKILGMEKDQANDVKLLWELLEKKRKYQIPESPLGPGELLPLHQSNNKRQKAIHVKPPVSSSAYSQRSRTPGLLAARIRGGHGKSRGQKVRSIFYKVNPSDVRHQRGAFGNAFDKLGQCNYKNSMDKWKTALKEAADLSGWPFKDGEYEADFIKKIIGELCTQVVKPSCELHVSEHLIGLESCRRDVYRLLHAEEDNVRMGAWWNR